jgi:hypothetical protein
MRRSCQEVYHRQTLMYYYQQRDGVSSPPWMTSGCHFDSDAKMYLQQRSRSPQHNGAQDHIHQRKISNEGDVERNHQCEECFYDRCECVILHQVTWTGIHVRS